VTGTVGCLSFVPDIGELIIGVWSLVKGALPTRLIQRLLGKGNYRGGARTARLYGSLLVAPYPLDLRQPILHDILNQDRQRVEPNQMVRSLGLPRRAYHLVPE
jgi:hypothetical protein